MIRNPQDIKKFVEKKFYGKNLEVLVLNLTYIGETADFLFRNLIKAFIENIELGCLRTFDFNKILDLIEWDLFEDDQKDVV